MEEERRVEGKNVWGLVLSVSVVGRSGVAWMSEGGIWGLASMAEPKHVRRRAANQGLLRVAWR